MEIDELRRQVDSNYAAFQAALARVPDDAWERPDLDGGWTVKEDLDHVTFWESVPLWRLGADVELPWPSDLPFGNIDAVNQRLREFTAGFSAAEVRERAARLHAALVSLLATLSNDVLAQVPEGDPWNRPNHEIIAADTCGHYPEHTEMLERVFS